MFAETYYTSVLIFKTLVFVQCNVFLVFINFNKQGSLVTHVYVLTFCFQITKNNGIFI